MPNLGIFANSVRRADTGQRLLPDASFLALFFVSIALNCSDAKTKSHHAKIIMKITESLKYPITFGKILSVQKPKIAATTAEYGVA